MLARGQGGLTTLQLAQTHFRLVEQVLIGFCLCPQIVDLLVERLLVPGQALLLVFQSGLLAGDRLFLLVEVVDLLEQFIALLADVLPLDRPVSRFLAEGEVEDEQDDRDDHSR